MTSFQSTSLNLEEGVSLNACFRFPASLGNFKLVPIMSDGIPEPLHKRSDCTPRKRPSCPCLRAENLKKKRLLYRRGISQIG